MSLLFNMIQLMISGALLSNFMYSDSEDDVILRDSFDTPQIIQPYSSMLKDDQSRSESSMNYEYKLPMMPKEIKRGKSVTIFQIPNITIDSDERGPKKIFSKKVWSESSADDDYVLECDSNSIKDQ